MGAIAEEHGLKRGDCSKMMSSLVDIATKEVKKTGVFTIPGLCRIKTRTKTCPSRVHVQSSEKKQFQKDCF